MRRRRVVLVAAAVAVVAVAAGTVVACRPHGPSYTTIDYTRPFDNGKPNDTGADGFYLDFHGSVHGTRSGPWPGVGAIVCITAPDRLAAKRLLPR